MPNGFKRHADQQENQRQRRQQDGERDFVGRFLPLRAFDQRDHAVQETFAGIDGDADFDLVGEHARAAGDGAAVAAAFADDGRGFAGDGGFIHRGRAFDDIAVGGNDFARPARPRHRPLRRSVALTSSTWPFLREAAGDGFHAGAAQGLGLGLAAAFGDGFGEIGEQHGEPEPERELRDEAAVGVRR